MKKNRLWIAVAALAFVACNNDDDSSDLPKGDYEDGILVSNEGPFQNGTGTVNFISDDYATEEATIYKNVNQEDLGNIVQSIGFDDDEAYIVVNNSSVIKVVNRYTFEKLGEISTGLNNPRHFVEADDKGFVTNWGDPNDNTDDFVAVIDLDSYTVINTIPVDFGPERLVEEDDVVYVAHQGGFGQNNKLSVIDADEEKVLTTIAVGDVPNSLAFDDAGHLWVLCAGVPAWTGAETAGALMKINTNSNQVETTLDFDVSEHPSFLNVEDNKVYYYLNGAVYEMATSSGTLPTQSLLDGVNFYTMTIDDDQLFGTDAGDYASQGKLFIYDLNNASLLKTFTVGIVPGGVYFN